MKKKHNLIDDLKRRFDCLISNDLTAIDVDSSIPPAAVSAEDMFPAQLTWTLVEVVRQFDVTQELIRKAKPVIDQFLRTGARRTEAGTYSERIPEGHWMLTVSDGLDGAVVRLMNEVTGEVFFVTEAMPMLFEPARAACHRTSSHVEDCWTPTTQRFYETVACSASGIVVWRARGSHEADSQRGWSRVLPDATRRRDRSKSWHRAVFGQIGRRSVLTNAPPGACSPGAPSWPHLSGGRVSGGASSGTCSLTVTRLTTRVAERAVFGGRLHHRNMAMSAIGDGSADRSIDFGQCVARPGQHVAPGVGERRHPAGDVVQFVFAVEQEALAHTGGDSLRVDWRSIAVDENV